MICVQVVIGKHDSQWLFTCHRDLNLQLWECHELWCSLINRIRRGERRRRRRRKNQKWGTSCCHTIAQFMLSLISVTQKLFQLSVAMHFSLYCHPVVHRKQHTGTLRHCTLITNINPQTRKHLTVLTMLEGEKKKKPGGRTSTKWHILQFHFFPLCLLLQAARAVVTDDCAAARAAWRLGVNAQRRWNVTGVGDSNNPFLSGDVNVMGVPSTSRGLLKSAS